MTIAHPVQQSVTYARESAHFALWCRKMARDFPTAELYREMEQPAWDAAKRHLVWAREVKKELAA